jgi:hypothetical protein
MIWENPLLVTDESVEVEVQHYMKIIDHFGGFDRTYPLGGCTVYYV